MITVEEYLEATGRALAGMAGIVGGLGDELANTRPPVQGASSPYALLTHCLGVVEYWAGGLVAGRAVERDRDAEFTSSGPVAPLLERVAQARERLAADARGADFAGPLQGPPNAAFLGPAGVATQGAALLHVYEELAQHHGQMEILRDLLRPQRPVDTDRLRSGTGVKWGSLAPDTLGAWVADMDLGIAPAIRHALLDSVDREDFGYPHWPGGDPVPAAFEAWMARRHGWTPSGGHTRVFTDVLQILQVVVEHATRPGDGVAIHVPAYPPFLASIARAGRRIVPLREDGLGLDDGVRLMVLVNPQNPTGRVFRREELEGLLELAERHDLTVLADEIHADLVYAPHRHLPFASLGEGAARRTVTTTSATKAFNLAGLRCAVAHVGPPALRAALDAMPLDFFGTPSTLGHLATAAAWRTGDAWLAGLQRTLAANRDTVAQWAAGLPIEHRRPEGTYLAWLGGVPGPRPAERLERTARVRLSEGAEFSAGTDVDTDAYVRLNFATSPAVLAEILERLTPAIAG
ncbi:MAG TPA: aminotransferase class I/II-fold pyridoxal phosphate-dependent enzyme [Dactylosporangium sp.]|jgi:bifunctional pyridoxal-dependent enzyme with beta-cystathionase and maltose regulon repressor activities|nr:aminotransferase class I/II-fold pyridoxal phosphate-dependent enzyme [Dactylosporangium sp.]